MRSNCAQLPFQKAANPSWDIIRWDSPRPFCKLKIRVVAWKRTFTLSRGAIADLATAPARPPATNFSKASSLSNPTIIHAVHFHILFILE